MVGRLLDLRRGARRNLRQVFVVDAAQGGGGLDGGFFRIIVAQQVRQQDDADQGMRIAEPGRGLMVIEHAVRKEGVQVPAFDQPCAGLLVGDFQRSFLDLAENLVVLGEEIGGVFPGRGRQ